MNAMATVLLIRHGRTTANAGGVLAGWTPGVDLDDTGRDQARRLGRRLADVPLRLLASSPLTRCLVTADLLLRERDDAVERVEDERLGECRYGAWTGRALSELAEEPLWRVVQQQPSAARFPDGEDHAGESLREMAARAVEAVREIDARVEAEHGPAAVWAAVSHGDVIKAILAEAAGTPLDLFQRYTADPCSVSAVRYTSARPFLILANDTGDLSHVMAGAHAAATDAVVGGGSGATVAEPPPGTPDAG